MTPEWLKILPLDLITEVSKKEKVDWKIMASLIYQESAGDPHAIRYEPKYIYLYKPENFHRENKTTLLTEEVLQTCSVGLCQLMFAVLREMGYRGDFIGGFDPRMNITFGARKIASLTKRFVTIENAISSYNQGGPYMKNGVLKNKRRYVDPIMKRIGQI